MFLARSPLSLVIISALPLFLTEATLLRASSKSKDPRQVFSSFTEATTKFQLRKLRRNTKSNTAITETGTSNNNRRNLLSLCDSDCDSDSDCEEDLICWQRDNYEDIPGCDGVSTFSSGVGFCVYPPDFEGNGGGDDFYYDENNDDGNDEDDDNTGEDDNNDYDPGRASPPMSATESIFLKMYWEPGYQWQGETFERKWCLRCYDRVCEEGTHAVITYCDTEDPTPLTFERYGGLEFRMRVSGGDTCVEMIDDSDRYTVLQPCSDSNLQRWVAQNGNPFKNEKFEITPKTLPNHCLTQTHDPKDGEPLWVASCEYARLTSAVPGSGTSYFKFYQNGESLLS